MPWACQKETALEIVNQNVDYLLAVESNKPKLAATFSRHFPMSILATYKGGIKGKQKNAATLCGKLSG